MLKKIYQDHIPCSCAEKLVCVDDKFSKPIAVIRGENAALKLLKQFLRSMNTVKEWQNTFQQKFDYD